MHTYFLKNCRLKWDGRSCLLFFTAPAPKQNGTNRPPCLTLHISLVGNFGRYLQLLTKMRIYEFMRLVHFSNFSLTDFILSASIDLSFFLIMSSHSPAFW